ncbi:MAG: CoA-binding protein [Candidatus Buchananbacteria bacterium]
MINKNLNYAVIGASANQEKYGFKVFKDLKEAGYKVIPVNPSLKELLGTKAYPMLTVVPAKIDVAIFVVPPAVTETILAEVKKLNIKKVWLQPGSESQKAIEFCEQNQIECIHDACIMIERQK